MAGTLTALALALPSAAAAADYYVDGSVAASGDCLTPATACKTVQEGVVKAQSAGPDTVHVAAGTYQGTVTMGSNVYDGTTLEGAGNGTVIEPPALATSIVNLGGGTPAPTGLTVRDLRVHIPAAAGGPRVAIAAAGLNTLIEDVTVDSEPADNYAGLITTGTGNVTLRRVTVSQPADDPSTPGDQPGSAVALSVSSGSGSLAIEDSVLTGSGVGPGPALDAFAGSGATGTVSVERTKLLTRGAQGYGARFFDVQASVESSLIAGSGGGAFLSSNNTDSTLSLDHVTIAPGGSPGVFHGLWVDTASTHDGDIQLKNSITTQDLHVSQLDTGTPSIACQSSDVPDPPTADTTGNVDCDPGTNGNSSSDSADLFADADFHPKGGGPAIDTGAASYAGYTGGDLGGDPRAIDGDGSGGALSDMGAYEYKRQAPTATAGATPLTQQAGTPIGFTGSATDPDAGDTFAYDWDYGDGTAHGSGAAPQHAYASAGNYTATLTVTDSGGRTATDTVDVTVTAAPAPPPGGGQQGGGSQTQTQTQTTQTQTQTGGTGGTGGTSTAVADVTPPLITQLKRLRKRFAFVLSEPATVKITIRQKKKRARHSRWTRRGTLVRSLPAGAQDVPFTGRIGRRALKPGTYRALLVATDSAGNASGPQRVTFRIKRR